MQDRELYRRILGIEAPWYVDSVELKWVKYTARGFRSRRNFVHAIYFPCGGLDLAPGATKWPEAPRNQTLPRPQNRRLAMIRNCKVTASASALAGATPSGVNTATATI
jgi:hypothetical protein